MICFKDRAYCNTGENKCSNKQCDRHPETQDKQFTLKKNTHNMPVQYTDFRKDCLSYKKKLYAAFQKSENIDHALNVHFEVMT